MSDPNETIEILTIEGKPWRVNAAKFEEMRAALMAALPAEPPGMSFAELTAAVKAGLDPKLFPGGAKVGWWLKAVQLDHEARGIVRRVPGRPLRFHRV